MLLRAMNVQISSMSACALWVNLTWNLVGMLELSQNLAHFARATCCDVLFAWSEQFRKIARLQMLLKCLGVDKHGVRFTVHGQNHRSAGLVHMVENLPRVPLQFSHRADVLSQTYCHRR